MSECPSTFFVDHGDYADPVECSLPIEHNADEEPWHSGGWDGEGEEVLVRWRWDKETLLYRWPRPSDPFSKVWSEEYARKLTQHMLDMTRLFENVPVRVVPATGTQLHWRKWSVVPTTATTEGPTEP